MEPLRCPHFMAGCTWEAVLSQTTTTSNLWGATVIVPGQQTLTPEKQLQNHLASCPFEAMKHYINQKETELAELRLQIQLLQKTLAGLSPSNKIQHAVLKWHTGAVVSLATAGNFLFSGSMDSMLKLWDLNTLQPATEVQMLTPVFQLKISGSRLYSGHQNVVRVWDLNSTALVSELQGQNGPVKAILVVANRLICGATNQIRIYDTNSLQLIQEIPGAHRGDVRDFVAVTDAAGSLLWVYSCGDDGMIRAWNREFRNERQVLAHRGPIRAMVRATIQNVGDFLVTGSDDTYIKLYDIGLTDPSRSMVAQVPCFVGVSALAFVPPCELISGHTDGAIRVWNMSDPRAMRCEKFLDGHTGPVRALYVHTNCFMSASYDHSIIVWYPQQQQQQQQQQGEQPSQ